MKIIYLFDGYLKLKSRRISKKKATSLEKIINRFTFSISIINKLDNISENKCCNQLTSIIDSDLSNNNFFNSNFFKKSNLSNSILKITS